MKEVINNGLSLTQGRDSSPSCSSPERKGICAFKLWKWVLQICESARHKPRLYYAETSVNANGKRVGSLNFFLEGEGESICFAYQTPCRFLCLAKLAHL